MPWAKVDDGWWCHPKVMGLPLAARGLWVSALSWSCQQREPVVPATFLAMAGATEADAVALIDAGLWERHASGYEFHDWAEYQDKSLSEKRAEAGRKGGLSRANASKPEAKAKQTEANDDLLEVANGQAGPSLPCPALPVPSKNTTTSPQSDLQPEPEPPPLGGGPDPDEQTVRKTAALVGRAVAGARDDGGAYANGVARRILKDSLLGADDLARIKAELGEGKTPEAIAAGWQDFTGDPHAGLFPKNDTPHPEQTRPRPPEFRGFTYDEVEAIKGPEVKSFAADARAALRGQASCVKGDTPLPDGRSDGDPS